MAFGRRKIKPVNTGLAAVGQEQALTQTSPIAGRDPALAGSGAPRQSWQTQEQWEQGREGPSLIGAGQEIIPSMGPGEMPWSPDNPEGWRSSPPPDTGVRSSIGFGGRPEGKTFDRPPTTPPGAADQAGDMMPVTPAVPGVGELVGQFQEQAEAARAANEARYAQGMGIHEQLVGDFGQGGTLQSAMMGQYQRQKERDLATQKQHMIGSGLMSTTIAAGMPAAYEEQVGTPYKMQMADLMAQRQAEAMRGQAGFIERREDIPPSPELMASLVQTASARPEDAAAGVTAEEGVPTTSTEIAAGGIPSMTDVASQHAFTPPAAPTTGGPPMPGFAAAGSGWGGGGSGGGLEFQIPDSTGGAGATVREPSKGTGPGATMTAEEGREVVKRFMGAGNKWMVRLADGRTMTSDAHRKLP